MGVKTIMIYTNETKKWTRVHYDTSPHNPDNKPSVKINLAFSPNISTIAIAVFDKSKTRQFASPEITKRGTPFKKILNSYINQGCLI